MSSALDIADAIKTRLEGSAGLAGIEILVDRQKDIAATVALKVGKLGNCVVILWQGHAVRDADASGPALDLNYTVSVYSRPVLAPNATPADEIMQAVIQRLWHWVPETVHSHGEARIGGGGLVPDGKFLIYDCDVTVPVFLTT